MQRPDCNLNKDLYKWDTTKMKDIEAFYALAFKYGFIDYQTYLKIILKVSIGNYDKKEQVIESPATYLTSETVEPITCGV
jgi:hypothetical protein